MSTRLCSFGDMAPCDLYLSLSGHTMQNTARSSVRMSVRPVPSIMRWLQRRFDFDLTSVRLVVKGHQGHHDVSRCSYADLFIYIFIYLFIIYLSTPQCSSRAVPARSKCSRMGRTAVESQSIRSCIQRLNSEGKAVEISTLVEILPYA